MKIAYLLYWQHGADSGIYEKILRQVRIWDELEVQVGVFVATSAAAEQDWLALPETKACHAWGGDVLSNVKAKHRAMRAAARWAPDIVYHRYSPPIPTTKWLARGQRFVLELNSDDRPEYALNAAPKRLYNSLARGMGLRAADGFVFVAQELEDRAYRRYAGNRPALVLANGIDLDDIPAAAEVRGSERPQAVFMGAFDYDWHGLDKLLWLAGRLTEWDFHLIGPPPGPRCPPNVEQHGTLPRAGYGPLLRSADVAFGTLALHRKHMAEASPLKTREYLAFGVPTVIGYEDTDFPGGADFLLDIGNDEGNVQRNVDAIAAFAQRWHGRRVPRDAIKHLDWRAKEPQRLDFFQSLLREARR